MTPPNETEDRTLAERLHVLLPEIYRDRDDILPVSMGSAGLKYGADGLVAWDEMWQSFCDLAMAGGPPHRGTFLAPATHAQIAAAPEQYAAVTQELCRGLHLVTGLFAEPAGPGTVRLYCSSAVMSGWLARAIVMENVWANVTGMQLLLPAGPYFRIEKEIKNVITSVAKTCHYWNDHTSLEQQDEIGHIFCTMHTEYPLIQPAIHEDWSAIDCGHISEAIRLMRTLAACNLFPRREDATVFIPVSAQTGLAVARAEAFLESVS